MTISAEIMTCLVAAAASQTIRYDHISQLPMLQCNCHACSSIVASVDEKYMLCFAAGAAASIPAAQPLPGVTRAVHIFSALQHTAYPNATALLHAAQKSSRGVNMHAHVRRVTGADGAQIPSAHQRRYWIAAPSKHRCLQAPQRGSSRYLKRLLHLLSAV